MRPQRPSRRKEKNLADRRTCTSPRPRPAVTPSAASRRRASCDEVTLPAAARVRRERRRSRRIARQETPCAPRPDFEVPRRDRRPEPREEFVLRFAELRHRRLEHPGGEPAPPGVGHRHRAKHPARPAAPAGSRPPARRTPYRAARDDGIGSEQGRPAPGVERPPRPCHVPARARRARRQRERRPHAAAVLGHRRGRLADVSAAS